MALLSLGKKVDKVPEIKVQLMSNTGYPTVFYSQKQYLVCNASGEIQFLKRKSDKANN